VNKKGREQGVNHEIHENIMPQKFGAIRYFSEIHFLIMSPQETIIISVTQIYNTYSTVFIPWTCH